MLFEVQAVDFFRRAYTKADGGADDAEYNVNGNEYVNCHCHHTQNLDEEVMGISCIEETVRFGEEARQNGAQGAASTMSGNGTYRVIDF